MLAGSLLAECGTGQVGDKFVSSDFSCPLGTLSIIGKRNAEYAARKKGTGAGSSTSVAALRQSEEDVQRGNSRIPEARLVLALLGMLMCIVGGCRLVSKITSVNGGGIHAGRTFVVWFRS